MNELEILTKMFDKIKENGWKSVTGLSSDMEARIILKKGLLSSFIFNLDVAKKFWGEEEIDIDGNTLEEAWEYYWKNSGHMVDKNDLEVAWGFDIETTDAWKYHLQQMVIEKDRLRYIDRFLK